jgi:hypothetical protein
MTVQKTAVLYDKGPKVQKVSKSVSTLHAIGMVSQLSTHHLKEVFNTDEVCSSY